MKQINKIENPDSKFDLYFLAYDSPKSLSKDEHWTNREGVLELTHNYGTENDDSFAVANGNSEPGKGFGHICISVDAIQAACQRIEDAGYKFQKKLTDGRMRSIAFALDPDGYWVGLMYNIFDQDSADMVPRSRLSHSTLLRRRKMSRRQIQAHTALYVSFSLPS